MSSYFLALFKYVSRWMELDVVVVRIGKGCNILGELFHGKLDVINPIKNWVHHCHWCPV
jgi:hypothetical protein